LKYAAGATAVIASSTLGLDILPSPWRVHDEQNSATNLTTQNNTTTTIESTLTSSSTSTQAVSSDLNRNGDFELQLEYWHPWHGVNEIGYPRGLPTTDWHYEIHPGQCGLISIDNPNTKLYDHGGLSQWSTDFPPWRQWSLSQSDLVLEAEVMIANEDALYDAEESWNRAGIALQCCRRDAADYVIDDVKHHFIYSEFDFYRDKANYFHQEGGDVYEYHGDQIDAGQFKKYRIDVNDFFKNGFENLGGWGDELASGSRLSAWYLVVESRGGRIDSAWRNIRISRK
jgi:hypothetical protein